MKSDKVKPVRKAIIAVAGYGTRFLPATKSIPKQMMPIIDKPIVQYVVEEAVASGIKDIILVTQKGQYAMEDHFDSAFELEEQLRNSHKTEMLRQLKEIPQMANFVYLRQTKDYPYGNATPLLVAKNLIDKDEPFAYYFGDDLVKSKVPCTKQLMKVFYKQQPAAILAVQKTPPEELYRYATVRYKKGTKINQIVEILEKMPPGKAPSDMAQFGRFIFSYKVIKQAEKRVAEGRYGTGNELWIADILNDLAKSEKIIAQPIKGYWMTTGDPLRYLQTMVTYALDREDIGPEFKKYLRALKV
ncbi:MAG TPA: UTP--glucose-1-phosphate uridylyltransferase [Candidatus Bathyarchaeia archaeon]|nr:UTP--glucose-1-phosphate uridylyltransferase [Candidatus Bathyarchaeia archaeon]